MDRRQFQARSLALLGAAALPGAARAQARPMGPGGFPNKPIKLVVPYPAGGIVDVVGRAVADPLSAELPQRIVVENRTGADGRIGLTAVQTAGLAAGKYVYDIKILLADGTTVVELLTGVFQVRPGV